MTLALIAGTLLLVWTVLVAGAAAFVVWWRLGSDWEKGYGDGYKNGVRDGRNPSLFPAIVATGMDTLPAHAEKPKPGTVLCLSHGWVMAVERCPICYGELMDELTRWRKAKP